MSKLLSVLLAGVFAGGAIAQTSTTTPSSGAVAGSASGSTSLSGSASNATSANTNNNANTSLNANTNTNTNSNTVNVYGPGSNKLARQQQGSGGAAVSMMPGQPHDGTGGTHGTRIGGSGEHQASNSTSCPPGLAKKDNGCLPPGQAKKQSSTSTMGNRGGSGDASAGAGGSR